MLHDSVYLIKCILFRCTEFSLIT